ncbi:uncharacterized protein LOC103059963 [Python bivittatus]|uniref:Uncharacterized protein LOC103059963 n=1 Tax=Python bivittatus TaxID=176946 RepID=A0A9F5IXE4_PYTBI|nr:uncharacterized protein LOC103059963 [Python bivittatus]
MELKEGIRAGAPEPRLSLGGRLLTPPLAKLLARAGLLVTLLLAIRHRARDSRLRLSLSPSSTTWYIHVILGLPPPSSHLASAELGWRVKGGRDGAGKQEQEGHPLALARGSGWAAPGPGRGARHSPGHLAGEGLQEASRAPWLGLRGRGWQRWPLLLIGVLPAEANKQERIVGEIAFQLDRRILSSIFPDRVRLYGFTVRNIPEKIAQREKDPFLQLSPEQSDIIMERYSNVMASLKPLGYDPDVHPRLTERTVNTFGILRERPEASTPEAAAYNDTQHLEDVVKSVAPPDTLEDCLLLLRCLHKLSHDDGKPLFIW